MPTPITSTDVLSLCGLIASRPLSYDSERPSVEDLATQAGLNRLAFMSLLCEHYQCHITDLHSYQPITLLSREEWLGDLWEIAYKLQRKEESESVMQ